MGARLFHRTTRRVALTDDGQAFLERCRRILEDVQEAEEVLTSRRLTLRGRLRVQMPLGFGRHVILPALPELLASYPELAVDVDLSDRVVDFTHEGLDLAVRIGPISDSRVIAKKLYDIRFVTCASPGYLKRKGTPLEPEDLIGHECLPYWMPPLGRHREWIFERGGVPFALPLSGRLNINNSEALIDAAVAGQGIVCVATFLAADAVRGGGKAEGDPARIRDQGSHGSAEDPPTRHLSTRIRAFLDFLAAVVPEEPAWDRAVLGSAGSGAPRRRVARR